MRNFQRYADTISENNITVESIVVVVSEVVSYGRDIDDTYLLFPESMHSKVADAIALYLIELSAEGSTIKKRYECYLSYHPITFVQHLSMPDNVCIFYKHFIVETTPPKFKLKRSTILYRKRKRAAKFRFRLPIMRGNIKKG